MRRVNRSVQGALSESRRRSRREQIRYTDRVIGREVRCTSLNKATGAPRHDYSITYLSRTTSFTSAQIKCDSDRLDAISMPAVEEPAAAMSLDRREWRTTTATSACS